MAGQSYNPHFFQPLLPGFHTQLNIPVVFFSKHLEGKNKTATLRSDASDKTWLVKMDGMKLTDGWEDFALAHDLRIGDMIIFRYEGEMVFHVTVLGPSGCEIQYTSSHNINDDSNDQTNIVSDGDSSRKKRVKKNPRNKVESSSNHSQFVASVSEPKQISEPESSSDHSYFEGCATPSGIKYDQLYLPTIFVSSNGLDKGCTEIVLRNERGREWTLVLTLLKPPRPTFLRKGWISFCKANRIEVKDPYKFKLVGTKEKPVLLLCPAESNRDKTTLGCSDGNNDVNSLSSNPSSEDDRTKSKGNEEESIEDKNISQGCLEIKKRKYGLRILRCKGSVDNMDDDQIQTDIVTGNNSRGKRVKKNPRNKVESSSDHSSFVAKVSASDITNDRLYLPTGFARFNGLDKMSGKKIVIGDEEGRSWEFNLKYYEGSMQTYAKHGWARFCAENKMSQGQQFTVELERKSKPPLMHLYLNNKKRKNGSRCGASSSSNQNRYVILTLTETAWESYKLFLPLDFTNANGINKPGKITLLGQDGVKWEVPLCQEKIGQKMRLGKGWREFCKAQGVKIEESFVLELIWEEKASPVLKFCSKFNSA